MEWREVEGRGREGGGRLCRSACVGGICAVRAIEPFHQRFRSLREHGGNVRRCYRWVDRGLRAQEQSSVHHTMEQRRQKEPLAARHCLHSLVTANVKVQPCLVH
jgi:hypothetical protein